MNLGVDLSVQEELKEYNPKYTYQGKEVEPFAFFKEHCGMKMARFRLWVDPYDEEGRPYGGGTNDLPTFIKLAKHAQECGMEVMLDIHYSDFFVDPSRQKPPRAWKGLNFPEMVEALKAYTRETLLKIKEEGIDLAAIQVGNETTNGMLHPFGDVWKKEFDEKKGGGFKAFVTFFNAGARVCKEIYPNAKIICHLEHSGSFKIQDEFMEGVTKEGIEFDVLGESYYTYWHGNLRDFKDSVSKISAKYNKPIWVVEAGYEFGPSRNPYHHSDMDTSGPDFIEGNMDGRVPFPVSKQGQVDYFKYFLKLCKEIGVEMVFYWEPTWIYLEGNGWAKDAGLLYCNCEPGTYINDWASETLFDFDGEATPAVEIFNQNYVDSL